MSEKEETVKELKSTFEDFKEINERREKEIEEFLTDLAVSKNVAASTQNQAFNALLFLYREILGMNFGTLENVSRAKKPRKLPVVFTREEIRAILDQLESDKWLMGQLLYGSGLRVMECVRLRVKAMEKHLRKVRATHQRDLKAASTPGAGWKGGTTYMNPSSSALSSRPSVVQAYPKPATAMPCGTVLPRISLKPAMISERFRSCLGIRM